MPRRRPPFVVGDRNARVLREHQHTQFVERVRAGLVKPVDRFAKPLKVGDLVLWHPTMDPCCRIMAIKALPIERQRPEESNGVELTLAITVQEAVDVRGPAIFFAKIGYVEEGPNGDTPGGSSDGQSTPDGQSPDDPPHDPESPDEPSDPSS